MIGIEARDIEPGDEIIGMGTVLARYRDNDGDMAVEFTKESHRQPVAFAMDAYLRVNRQG